MLCATRFGGEMGRYMATRLAIKDELSHACLSHAWPFDTNALTPILSHGRYPSELDKHIEPLVERIADLVQHAAPLRSRLNYSSGRND